MIRTFNDWILDWITGWNCDYCGQRGNDVLKARSWKPMHDECAAWKRILSEPEVDIFNWENGL